MLTHSKAGVHESDAMGPLGFALGLEGALDQCADAEQALVWARWYLDDGTIIGSPDAISNYLSRLIPALKSVDMGGEYQEMSTLDSWGPSRTTKYTHGSSREPPPTPHPSSAVRP